MNPKSVCRYNKFGYCRFSDKCRFRHNDVLCADKNCDVFKCEKRHPKICTYQRDFGRCKFTTFCRYNHEKEINVQENSEKIKAIEKKLKDVKKKYDVNNSSDKIEKIENKLVHIEKNQEMINEKNILKKLEAVEKTYQSEIETLKEQLRKMNKTVQEKDFKISLFENELKELKVKFEEQESVNKNIKEKADDIKKVKKHEQQFLCQVCEFQATSKNNLKVHMKRKHTSYSDESLPVNCDICEEKFIDVVGKPWDKERIDQHRISHSYKCSSKLNYKCEECEFWGPNTLTMEMHVKKQHSEKISCGMCDLEIKQMEEL